MAADQELDQTEQATPHKLQQARDRASVARSSDAVSVAMLAVTTLALFALTDGLWRGTAALMRRLLGTEASGDWTPESASAWMAGAFQEALALLGPLFGVLLVSAVAINLAQTRGLLLSLTPLKPDLARLNPAAGFKRWLSLRFAYEGLKGTVKLVVLGWVAAAVISSMVQGLLVLASQDPKAFPPVLVALTRALFMKLVIALALMAVVDVIFTRWEFLRRMRMSRREVREEHKQREGDPRIRSRLRQLRTELLKRTRAAANVAQADVLITNPTHLAVAIRFRAGEDAGPRVIAKGSGELAQQMRALAWRARVPVVESRRVARALYRQVPLEGYVPEAWYPDLARILVWVRSQAAARANGPEGRP